MKINEQCLYTRSHEWVRVEEDSILIGLSDYAQQELGDIVFVNLPEVEDEIIQGESFADVESVKAVSEVYAPMNSKVIAIHEELLDSPEKINEDPYEAWLVRVEKVGLEDLMDASSYQAYLETL